MGSKNEQETITETNNLALDLASTNGEGTQILDSIIVDPSDTVMIETINQHAAAFEALMGSGTIQMTELLGLGKDLLTLVNEGQVQMMSGAYHQLDTGVRMLEEQMQQGKYVIDLTSSVADQSFELAGTVAAGNDDRLSQALDLVGDVKVDGYRDLVRSFGVLVMIFGLGALYLSSRN